MEGWKFSWKVTLVGILAAGLMLRASFWQYERYHDKKALLEGYALNSITPALPFPLEEKDSKSYSELIHRKIELEGEYDFDNQFLISNRKDRTGPGFLLLTPFRIHNSEQAIVVSRGFIPFADRDFAEWAKYDREPREILHAVVQQSVPQKYSFVPSATEGSAKARIFLYADLERIAQELDYPINQSVFLQRLSKPGDPLFPKEAISIRVPPSTHFGYTIEWALLAFVSLLITIAIQLFPGLRKRFSRSGAKTFTRKQCNLQDK